LNPDCIPGTTGSNPCIVKLPSSGSLLATQVGFGDGSNALSGNSNFTFNNNILTVGGTSSSLGAVFSGSGLNDLSVSGTYTGSASSVDIYLLSNAGNTSLDLSGRSANFQGGETITGGTSGATGTLVFDTSHAGANAIYLSGVSGTFQSSETVTGGTSGSTATVTSNNGTLPADVFAWFESNGSGPVGPVGPVILVGITGSGQALGSTGITATFGATSGHTVQDVWTITQGSSSVGEIDSHIFKGDSLVLKDGSGYTFTLSAPTLSGDIGLVFPNSQGTNGQVLTTNGSGGTSWTTPAGGGGTIGGSIANNQIAVGSSANTINGFSYFTYNNGSGGIFTVGDSMGMQYMKAAGGGNNHLEFGSPGNDSAGVLTLDQFSSSMISRYNNSVIEDLAGNQMASFNQTGPSIFTQIGDLSNSSHGTKLIIDDSNQTLKAYNHTAGDISALSLDFQAHEYRFGTNSVISGNNGTNVGINDMASQITLMSNFSTRITDPSLNKWFEVSPSASTVSFGNITGSGTQFTLDDTSHQVSVTKANKTFFGTNEFDVTDPANTVVTYISALWNGGSPRISFGLTGVNAVGISVDDPTNTIRTESDIVTMQNPISGNIFFAASGTNGSVALGDTGGAGNGTKFVVDDSNSDIIGTIPNPGQFQVRNTAGHTVLNINPLYSLSMGDVNGIVNSTVFSINDSKQAYMFTKPNFTIAAVPYVFPGSQGAASAVLTNDGSGNLTWGVPSTGWNLTGNAGTTAGTNFIGTTDNKDFVIKSNGNEMGRFYSGVGSAYSVALGGGTALASGMFVFGQHAGSSATSASESNFIGNSSGNAATNASSSNFIGFGAGADATDAGNSNFLGFEAGLNATNASDSNFMGADAGSNATNATGSNFFGLFAGNAATNASSSNFMGFGAGADATNAPQSNFLGTYAGNGATNAAHSLFIGYQSGQNDTVNNTSSGTSILIGDNTSTAGFSNSIALGAHATNTAANQFMIGSTSSPVNTTRFQGSSAGTQCTITTGTGIACTSDERLKTNILDLSTTTLDNLLKVRTVNYNLIGDTTKRKQVGFLAQDLEQYFPTLVDTGSDGYKSVYYAQMTPILTEAIRELHLKLTDIQKVADGVDPTFLTNLKNWLASETNGIVDLFAGTIHAKDKLCVGSVCVTQDQFLKMVQTSNGTLPVIVSGGSPAIDNSPITSSTSSTTTGSVTSTISDTSTPVVPVPVMDPTSPITVTPPVVVSTPVVPPVTPVVTADPTPVTAAPVTPVVPSSAQ
jgi:hypothetical protein